MKINYPTKKLGEICDVVTGSTPKTSVPEYYGEDYLWARPGDLDEGIVRETEKKLSEFGFKKGGVRAVPKGSVMMCCIGSIGKLGIASEEMVTNQQINSFVPDTKKIDPMFLFYAIVLYRDKFVSGASSTTLKIINKTRCENMEIPLPPLVEQKKIVAKLEKLLAKVSEAKKLRAEARESADDLLSAELHKVFSEGKEKGWEEKELSEITNLLTDGDWIETKDQSESGIRLIQTGNIGLGKYLDKPARARYISEHTFRRLRCTEILPGDILISRLPDPVGRACLVPESSMKMITAVDCAVVRVNQKVTVSKFVVYYTMSPQYFDEIQQHLSGTTRKRISRKNLGRIKIPLPSLAEQKKIVARLDLISQKTEAVKELQNTTENEFGALESSVLSQAFNG